MTGVCGLQRDPGQQCGSWIYWILPAAVIGGLQTGKLSWLVTLNRNRQKLLLRHADQPSLPSQFSLTVALVNDLNDFMSLSHDWNQVNLNSWQPSIFRTWEWAYYWWQVFLLGNPDWLRILTVRDTGGELVAIFAFHCMEPVQGKKWARGWRFIRDLGWQQERMAEEPTIAICKGREREVFDVVTRFLATASEDWDFYRIDVQAQSALFEEQSQGWSFEKRLVGWHRQEKPGSSLVTLPSTWEAFRKTLSRSMRDNLTYYPRKLTKAGLNWRIRFLTTADDVRAYLPHVIELHRHRAKNREDLKEHCDHIPEPLHQEFLQSYLPMLAERGESFIAALEIDDVPVAAQLFFVFDNVLTFYYSGFETVWYPYSPLFIVATEVIKAAITRGVRAINFLPGDAPWKSRWGATIQDSIYSVFSTRIAPGSLFRLARAAFARRYQNRHSSRLNSDRQSLTSL